MQRWTALCGASLLLLCAAVANADPLDDLAAIEQATELSLIVASLNPATPPGEEPSERVTLDLAEFEVNLQFLASEIQAGKSRTEIYPLFHQIALQRHRLFQHFTRGRIDITEAEFEAASDLFEDLAAYFRAGGS